MAQILIIEDDPASLTLLFECLSSLGHDVDCATDREPAETMLDCVRYDLVISDLRLAGEDGLRILAGIRQLWPATRLLLVSADLLPETENEARIIGVDGCFAKPLELRLLTLMVEQLVRPCGRAVC